MNGLSRRGLVTRAFLRKSRTELLFVLLVLLACIYAALNRALEDFILPSAVLAVLAACAGYYHVVSLGISSRARQLKFERSVLLVWFVYFPVVAAICGIIYYSAWVVLKDAYLWILEFAPPRPLAYATTIPGVLLIGYALFQFRMHARFFYGLAEAGVGVLVTVMRMPVGGGDPFDWDSPVYIAILTAGVFLIVRGFDNMHIGLRSDSYDGILKEIKERDVWMRRNTAAGDDAGRGS